MIAALIGRAAGFVTGGSFMRYLAAALGIGLLVASGTIWWLWSANGKLHEAIGSKDGVIAAVKQEADHNAAAARGAVILSDIRDRATAARMADRAQQQTIKDKANEEISHVQPTDNQPGQCMLPGPLLRALDGVRRLSQGGRGDTPAGATSADTVGTPDLRP